MQRHSCGRRQVAAPLTAYVRKQTHGLSESRQAIANATFAHHNPEAMKAALVLAWILQSRRLRV